MSISEPFIRRPIGTSLLMLGVLVFGIGAYGLLPVAPLPNVDFPTITVTASYPGASPQTMASAIATPLEQQFTQIPALDQMTSLSGIGTMSITLQFDLSRNIDGAAVDVVTAINAATGLLPKDLPSPPTYRKVNPADFPIMIYAVHSDAVPEYRLDDYANTVLGERLSTVPGVGQVSIFGQKLYAARVQVNPAALAAHGIGIEDVRNALVNATINEPKGTIEGADQVVALETNDQLFDAEAYGNIIIAYRNGAAVRIKDVGNAFDSVQNARVGAFFNNKAAEGVAIQKAPGANTVALVNTIKELMPKLQASIPPSVHVDLMLDRTLVTRAAVRDVQLTMMLTIALVVIVIFLFLRTLWATVIPSLAVPLSLLATFSVMYVAGFSLDNISLMALTISVGFVVDDAIVMIENIVRYIEHGDRPFEAALKGAGQIGFTIISITFSLIAVFIPLFAMGGVIGRLFREFAITVSVAVMASAIVSLTLTPVMCSLFLKEQGLHPQGRFNRAAERFFERVIGAYDRGLNFVFRHQFAVLVSTLLLMVATGYLYVKIPKGFFPQQDTGMVMGITEAAQDISFDAMVAKQNQVTEIVKRDPAVASITSAVGSGGGGSSNTGRMFITLKPRRERNVTATEVVARIRGKTARIPGIGVFLQAAQDIRIGGRATKGQYIYSLVSPSQEDLNTYVPKLLAELQKNSKLKDLTTDQQQLGLQSNVIVDRVKASQLGIQPQQVDSALDSAFGQRQVSVVYNDRDQFHVVLEALPQYLADPTALNKIYIAGVSGIEVPLSAIAKIQTTNTPTAINHQGQFPAVTFSFNLDPGTSLQQATQIIEKAARDIHMPDTIRGSFQGTAQVFQDSLSSEPILILTAIIAVYIVLGVLYESYIHPLTILSTLPSAGLGALLALLICRVDLSIVSIIGIILLIGIVKKNAIMMVDFALEVERDQKMSPAEAIYQACCIRFRPIMMTTLAAMFGAVPLALGQGDGSEIRQPLGVAIIGGLIVSQMLTLYTTPVIYLYLDRLRQRKSGPEPVAVPHPA